MKVTVRTESGAPSVDGTGYTPVSIGGSAEKLKYLLETDGMPCALFAHPEEVDRLVKDVGADRTG